MIIMPRTKAASPGIQRLLESRISADSDRRMPIVTWFMGHEKLAEKIRYLISSVVFI
jgi:hypothetical protein